MALRFKETRLGAVVAALGIGLLTFDVCLATPTPTPTPTATTAANPFSASTTYRESKKITLISDVPPFNRTYAALTKDSKDLSFQELASGRSYLVFASLDPSLDDAGSNRCQPVSSNPSDPLYDEQDRYQIYWVDKYADRPAVCLSYRKTSLNSGVQAKGGDSVKPLVGGPEGDEGRYVAYETDATNLYVLPTPGAGTPTPIPGSYSSTQIVVHDKKWQQNFISESRCGKAPGDGPSHLWDLSEDGKYILMTSSASNQIDNLNPKCTDGGTVSDVFIRDGSNCEDGMVGACYTSILYDSYGYHAGPNTVESLDEDSQNVQMNSDHSVVVFDTSSTAPIHFDPDILNHKDIYYHTQNTFTRISQSMLPLCSVEQELLPLTNEFGPANGDSENPSVNATGRYVAFQSVATDLVVNERDGNMVCSTPGAPHPATFSYVDTHGSSQVYVYDKLNKKVELISLKYKDYNSNPQPAIEGGLGDSSNPKISADGRFVFFESNATDLRYPPTTPFKNIFMYDRLFKKMYLVTTGVGGSGLDNDATMTHVGSSGLSVAFQTRASNVVTEGPSQGTPGGVSPSCGDALCQQVYIAKHNCPTDTDGDLVPDCLDECPYDPAKVQGLSCGCGEAETDSDNDFTPDCIDGCPEDADKTAGGACGCGVADTDSDGDGTANCIDACPSDPGKQSSTGLCGCGVSDVDADGDGRPTCGDADKCDSDPNRYLCECGALKDEPGVCGCDVADTDANGNGVADCLDPTSATVPALAVYEVSQALVGNGRKSTNVRFMMQNFAGRKSYRYSLTRSGYRVSGTSANALVSISNLRPGTYTFSYSVTLGRGAGRITTQVRSQTVRIR